jgi:transcriptional regulator with XRE-family HTH domain
MKMLTQGKPLDERIKKTRMKYGLTQKQVSDITGVPHRSIQNWEGGQRSCPDYVTGMIVNILDQKFGQPDNQTFLEELLGMLQSDVKYARTEETKNYISNLISDISEHLNK